MAWDLVQRRCRNDDAAMVTKVLTGAAERPPWEVVRAVLDGMRKLLNLLHRQGCNPHAVVAMRMATSSVPLPAKATLIVWRLF